MADQASMNRVNGSPGPASPGSLIGNIADFANDVTTLAELQAKLTVHDAKECAGKVAVPLAVLVAGSILALGSVPVILLGLADVIATSLKMSAGVAQLIVGLVFLIGAGIAGTFAIKASLRSLESFRRSNEELTRNLSWIRTVLVHSGRSVARPRV